ncbi:uncharacterized protein LOC122642767 [Telopea speciosissima]|uniref:uncharacterized protein LOC122642767 n=1 Tax=Telopea speciosissima TaxID=54955 RepID=UPI001CC69DB6|nr:uncharacterized protein LOC122642767 [Telopea speciosissima]
MATLSSFSLPKLLPDFRRSNSIAKIPAISVSGIGTNSPFHTRFRYEKGSRSGMKQRLCTVFASDTNPSGEDSPKNKAKGSEDAKGPPFLTILAGFVAFLVIFWIVGSIVTWLIGLIVNVPKLK